MAPRPALDTPAAGTLTANCKIEGNNEVSMKRMRQLMTVFVGTVALVSLAACGGSGSANEPTNTSVPPTSTTAATPTATMVPATPTATTAPSPTAMSGATGTAGGADAQLIAEGKQIFEVTAGNIGCAYCHTKEATGDVAIGSPDIRGVTQAQIIDALETRAQMTFITMTDQEIKAVAAYLKTLAPQ